MHSQPRLPGETLASSIATIGFISEPQSHIVTSIAKAGRYFARHANADAKAEAREEACLLKRSDNLYE
jgi:hypothetical protein